MALKTVYVRNDAYSIESDPEGVRIAFKKRVALPLLSPSSAEDLAKLLVRAANESRRLNSVRPTRQLYQDYTKDGSERD